MKLSINIALGIFISIAVIWIWYAKHQANIQRLQDAGDNSQAAQTNAFKQEYTRMSAWASAAHEKCPIKPALNANGISSYSQVALDKNFGAIPAYPHLSDIYLYVLPPMKRSDLQGIPEVFKTGNPSGYTYTPLTETDIENYWNSIKKHHPEYEQPFSPSQFLTTAQSENLTPVIVNILRESLAYCIPNNSSIKRQIKIVDTSRHQNINQEDALTFVAGIVLYNEPLGGETQRNRARLMLQTSQYIPRWKIFPTNYVKVKRGKKIVMGLIEREDDPFYFYELTFRSVLKPPIPLEYGIDDYRNIWFGGTSRSNLTISYKLLEKRKL